MKDYQREFIDFCIENKVLRFGSFTLKSGRISPYFFNAGLFCTGKALSRLGVFYASALRDGEKWSYDVLFGPAYKGFLFLWLYYYYCFFFLSFLFFSFSLTSFFIIESLLHLPLPFNSVINLEKTFLTHLTEKK